MLHNHRLALLLAGAIVAAAFFASCDDNDDAAATPPAEPTVAASATPEPGPAISIDAPNANERVTIPFRVSGTANVFEGAFEVVISATNGDVLCKHNVQATSGSGTRGTWITTMAFVLPHTTDEDFPATIRAISYSAADGSIEYVTQRPVSIAPDLPAIVITSPGCSEELSAGSTLTVTGLALVFEAVLQVGVRDASGAELIRQRVMAASGTEFSPWSTELDLSALPGAGIYEVVAYNFSARDGSIENEFAVPIVLQ